MSEDHTAQTSQGQRDGPFEWCPDCDEEFHHSETLNRECPKCGGRLE